MFRGETKVREMEGSACFAGEQEWKEMGKDKGDSCLLAGLYTCLAMPYAGSLQSVLHPHQTPFLTFFLGEGLYILYAHVWESV